MGFDSSLMHVKLIVMIRKMLFSLTKSKIPSVVFTRRSLMQMLKKKQLT